MRKWQKLSRDERIRLKALICVLGVILLVLLLGGHFLLYILKPAEEVPELEPEPTPYVPVVMELHNVWLMEVGEEDLLLFRDGVEERYDLGEFETDSEMREQIADVVLTDGLVTDLHVKKEKIRGAVLSANDTTVELEGYGRLPLAEDFKGYRIYNTLSMCTQRDLAFGYDFADFVIEDGEICGILMAREEAMEDIRVLIRNADYAGRLHQEIAFSVDTDYVIRYGGYDAIAEEIHAPGDEVTITPESAYFTGGRVAIVPVALTGRIALKNVNRSQGIPRYRGYMELTATEEGIAVVNVVPLEEYLYSVVPSEMPASYPMEALKAQAVCARTYAYGHMLHASYPSYGAHLDDSATYQVYNNIKEQESTTAAVKETYGKLLYTAEGGLAETYYYSTSCGVGSDANVWKTEAAKAITYLRGRAINPSAMGKTGAISEDISMDIPAGEYLREEEHFASFITSVDPDDFEASEAWYRWTYQVKKFDPEYLLELLKKRYQANGKLVLTLEDGEYVSREIEDFSEVQEMYIAARGEGGVADELVIETDAGTYKVVTEHNIRCVLCDGDTKVVLQNGSKVNMPTLLPSGFFILETGNNKGNVVEYKITGGGFGHGVGMSQNAAKSMAKQGYTAEEILLFFYEGCSLRPGH